MYLVTVSFCSLVCFTLLLGVSGDNEKENCNNAKTFLIINLKIHFDLPILMSTDGTIKQVLKGYWPLLVSKVEGLYRQPAMSLPLKINVLDVNYLWSGGSLTQTEIHKSKYLDRYCKWQNEQKNKEQRMWLSVIFTELNLFKLDIGQKKWTIYGTSYSDRYCRKDSSCIIIHFERDSDNMAYVLAHEIAHSIGVRHDVGNQCIGFHIMDANNIFGTLPTTWSNCSRNWLNEFLVRSDNSWCLGDYEYRMSVSKEYYNE